MIPLQTRNDRIMFMTHTPSPTRKQELEVSILGGRLLVC